MRDEAVSKSQVHPNKGLLLALARAAFVNLGYALGVAVGGMALIWFGYESLGAALGLLGIVAAVVFYVFARDPTRK